MTKEYPARILRVFPEGLADELGLVAGDKIIKVNEVYPRDIIDMSFALADEDIELLVEHEDGERELIAFDKDVDEELGCEFESAVFDRIRSCANHCYFCFVDMIAPHMRNSLSIKDDDYRLSFLYGNFVTLTNLGERDFERIERLHLSPLYVSIQCMNPELRAQLLRCKAASKINEHLDRLEQAGVEYHTQVVLCSGLNDGAELDRTIREVLARRPHVLDLAIVPVGITKFRTDPFPLEQFDKAGAERVIDQVEKWQAKMREEEGRTFVYLGDEFYFLAGRPVPPTEVYDGYPQLDNGIGLTRNFIDGWEAEPDAKREKDEAYRVDVISGTAVAHVLEELAASLATPGVTVRVLPVSNDFFGTTVNVSGLLTATDIRRKLREAGPGDLVLLPSSALREGEDIFLDDVTLDALQAEFPEARLEVVSSGRDYRQALTNPEGYHKERATEKGYMWQSNAGYTKPAI